VFAVLGPPCVDVGLAAGCEGGVPLAEPVEEGGRVLHLLGREAADAGCDVALLGACPQPGQDAPGREEPDRFNVRRVLDAGQMAMEPALERAEVLVHRGQDPACHQEFFEVSG
jgi:hypothetical protein